MSNTNTNLQTQTSNALHNAIMETGGKDRPPMLAPEAHYMYMVQIQEVTPDATYNSGPIFDTEPLQKEQGDTNITIDSLDMSTNRETVDQDDDDLAKEGDLLASLIEKLKCEIDDSKNRNKYLESLNKTLIDKLRALEYDETILIAQES
nr:hypothetical protein [Tanacetum cinerariifolium]